MRKIKIDIYHVKKGKDIHIYLHTANINKLMAHNKDYLQKGTLNDLNNKGKIHFLGLVESYF